MHDGAEKGSLYGAVLHTGRETVKGAQKEYFDIHDLYCARVELLFCFVFLAMEDCPQCVDTSYNGGAWPCVYFVPFYSILTS